MGEAENPLREEIEKVRERARLQALAQGLSPDEAEAKASDAVAEFCSRWGVRPDMLGPAPPRIQRDAAARKPTGSTSGFFAGAIPLGPEKRSVDLGSSPLRSGSPAQDKTGPIRIGDLLKKSRAEGAAAPPGKAAAPAGTPGAPPRASLSSLLNRVKNASLPDAVPAVEEPPAPEPAAPAGPPRKGAFQIRNVSVQDQVAALPGSPRRPGPAPAAPEPGMEAGDEDPSAQRRRILDEFDRTYAEVHEMLEKRIGADLLAMAEGREMAGEGMAGTYSGDEIRRIVEDIDRLRGGLQQMLGLCDELMQSLRSILLEKDDGRDPA